MIKAKKNKKRVKYPSLRSSSFSKSSQQIEMAAKSTVGKDLLAKVCASVRSSRASMGTESLSLPK